MNTRQSEDSEEGLAPDILSSDAFGAPFNGGDRTPLRQKWRGFYTLLVLVASIVGFGIGVIVGSSRQEFVVDTPTINQCMSTTISLLDFKQHPSQESLNGVVEQCYALLRSQGIIKDFAIRELNFIQQYRANGVLMWMVVAVTISGVILAGLQLMASYQLASSNQAIFDHPNEFTLRRDRVILKSSITGLFILLISFAFFLVFVTYVYRFEGLEDHIVYRPVQVPTLPMGQLGGPPPAAVK